MNNILFDDDETKQMAENNTGASRGQDVASQSFKETTDPNVIQEWAEVRGATPVRDLNDESDLKLLFGEGEENTANLQKISWEEFFELFAENDYKFCYQDQEDEDLSEKSALGRDYKIVKR